MGTGNDQIMEIVVMSMAEVKTMAVVDANLMAIVTVATSKLKTTSDDPDAWLTNLEQKCQCMMTLGMMQSDDNII